mmetsp:Transcript_12784/g.39255  ORF Transcript_12784/g.39255 Transcript_12784/m.39255 type:complete len:507 (+) Transcript_12784:192-1712(+)
MIDEEVSSTTFSEAPSTTALKARKDGQRARGRSGFDLNSRASRVTTTSLQWAQLVLCYGFTLYALGFFLGTGRFRTIYEGDRVAQIGAVVHIVPAALWFLLAPLQFLDILRQRYPKVHRVVGRVAVGLSLALVLGGYVVAFTPRPEGGLGSPVYIVSVGSLYIFFIARGLLHIRSGKVQLHALYMSRAQMLALAIIFMRPITAVVAVVKQDDPSESRENFAVVLGLTFFFTTLLVSLAFEAGRGLYHSLGRASRRIVRVANAANLLPASDYHRRYTSCKVVEVVPQTDSVALIRLRLPDSAVKLYTPIGAHCQLRAAAPGGKKLSRPCTPLELPETPPGCVDFVVKRAGKVSGILHSLSAGAVVDILGPISTPFYLARNAYRRLICIGGGTGITPIYNVMKSIASDEGDRTDLTLISVNRSADDEVMGSAFGAVSEHASALSKSMRMYFLTGNWRSEWSEIIGEGNDETGIVLCGPPGMMHFMMRVLRREMRLSRSQIYAIGMDDR